MNILLFIYIFSLFVITTPNVLFKIPGKCGLGVTMLHAFVFTFILYFTYDTVSISIVEGAMTTASVSGLNTTTDDVDENSDTAAKTALDAATAKTAFLGTYILTRYKGALTTLNALSAATNFGLRHYIVSLLFFVAATLSCGLLDIAELPLLGKIPVFL